MKMAKHTLKYRGVKTARHSRYDCPCPFFFIISEKVKLCNEQNVLKNLGIFWRKLQDFHKKDKF